MSRGFAVVVSALVAFAAQAQEAAGAEAQSANPSTESVSTSRPVMVAIRTDPPAPAPARTVAPASGGGTGPTRPGTVPAEEIDCSVVETFLDGTWLAVRTYEAPPGRQTTGWKQAPFVAAVARCGRLYVLQVWSTSRTPWTIRQARVEGAGGMVLKVEALRSSARSNERSINVIVAKAPPGAKLPMLTLDLSGEDGRVAQTEVGDLP